MPYLNRVKKMSYLQSLAEEVTHGRSLREWRRKTKRRRDGDYSFYPLVSFAFWCIRRRRFHFGPWNLPTIVGTSRPIKDPNVWESMHPNTRARTVLASLPNTTVFSLSRCPKKLREPEELSRLFPKHSYKLENKNSFASRFNPKKKIKI